MSEPLHPKKIAALLAAPGPVRFDHLITQAADSETLWGLKNAEGWVSLVNNVQAGGFVIWPHPDFAQACATGDWAGCEPAAIDIYRFVEDWLPDMASKGLSIAVFPTPAMRGVWIAPGELKSCLEEELAQYE
ncbi:DUF2750 domain-containing protein [Massilia sp. NR 4-1]|uniref:DUF2750 domain-containing protein n=1 Tax=Massilia sp. NR 4-1 TaxID=1678028 RepID=UPI0009E33045|nr:DUF2750 domain-containing protein [Massilia sp. NR 4-1]